MPLTVHLLQGEYAICRFAPQDALPPELWRQPFVAVTRTPEELSVVCPVEARVPGAQRVERGWAVLGVRGPLDFSLVGVLSTLTGTLAAAGVSVCAVSTFDTDYLLVRRAALGEACRALQAAGHSVEGHAPLPAAGAPDPRTQVRRRKRAVYDADWIVARLRAAEYGVLATCQNGQPFTVARNFAYDAERHCLYLHGARKGRTFEIVQPGARANFNVSRMGRLLPGAAAMDMSVEYEGVVLFGRISLVDDPAEAKTALQLLLDKYFPHLQPGREYIPVREVDLKVTAVLRLDIESWSGKRKQAPAAYPGAFRFGAEPWEDDS